MTIDSSLLTFEFHSRLRDGEVCNGTMDSEDVGLYERLIEQMRAFEVCEMTHAHKFPSIFSTRAH